VEGRGPRRKGRDRPDQARPERNTRRAPPPITLGPARKCVANEREEEQRTHDVHADGEDVIAGGVDTAPRVVEREGSSHDRPPRDLDVELRRRCDLRQRLPHHLVLEWREVVEVEGRAQAVPIREHDRSHQQRDRETSLSIRGWGWRCGGGLLSGTRTAASHGNDTLRPWERPTSCRPIEGGDKDGDKNL